MRRKKTAKSRIKVKIKKLTPRAKAIRTSDIKKAVRKTLEFESRAGEVSVALVDDERIREMNRVYRGIGRPTDVLAFYFNEEDISDKEELLGDVIISVDTAIRQGKRYRQTPDMEIALYAVHGTLHLLGYKDESEAGRRTMRKKERAIMKQLYGS